MVYEQLLTGANADGTPKAETTPFVVMMLEDEEVTGAIPDGLNVIDACFPNITDDHLVGTTDLNRDVPLTVGSDTLTLRRSPNWVPGEVFYVYDPWDPYLDVGRTTGAPLALDGVDTSVQVPPTFVWEPGSWTELLKTGVLHARWTPGSGSDLIYVSLHLFDVSYTRESAICYLFDDGQASIDLGFDPAQLQAVELTIGRKSNAYVQHDEFGALYVEVLRHLRLVQDHMIE
jgi:hypothetical protein